MLAMMVLSSARRGRLSLESVMVATARGPPPPAYQKHDQGVLAESAWAVCSLSFFPSLLCEEDPLCAVFVCPSV